MIEQGSSEPVDSPVMQALEIFANADLTVAAGEPEMHPIYEAMVAVRAGYFAIVRERAAGHEAMTRGNRGDRPVPPVPRQRQPGQGEFFAGPTPTDNTHPNQRRDDDGHRNSGSHF